MNTPPARRVVLPNPLPHQVGVLCHPARTKLVVCGRRWGKTMAGLIAVVEGHGPERRRLPGRPRRRHDLVGRPVVPDRDPHLDRPEARPPGRLAGEAREGVADRPAGGRERDGEERGRPGLAPRRGPGRRGPRRSGHAQARGVVPRAPPRTRGPPGLGHVPHDPPGAELALRPLAPGRRPRRMGPLAAPDLRQPEGPPGGDRGHAAGARAPRLRPGGRGPVRPRGRRACSRRRGSITATTSSRAATTNCPTGRWSTTTTCGGSRSWTWRSPPRRARTTPWSSRPAAPRTGGS